MRSRAAKTIFLMKVQILILCFLNAQNAVCQDADIDRIISNSIREYKNVSDFTCRLEKTVNKAGRIYHDPDILVKYKKPGHYYFRWQEGEFKGQEVIYVAGKYNDKLVAHSGGFFKFITLHLNPEGTAAMKRNHHPLTESGLEKIMKIIERDYNRFKKTGMGRIQLLEETSIDGKQVRVIHCAFPENQDFYAHRIILYFDRELNLPIKITAFDWKGSLFEEYYFRDLQINTGFEERDFDPENPEYNY